MHCIYSRNRRVSPGPHVKLPVAVLFLPMLRHSLSQKEDAHQHWTSSFPFFSLSRFSPLFHIFWSKRHCLFSFLYAPLCLGGMIYMWDSWTVEVRPFRHAPTVFGYAGCFPSFTSGEQDEGKIAIGQGRGEKFAVDWVR